MKKNIYHIACDVFCTAMLSVFLLGFWKGGYTVIRETKLWIYVGISVPFLLFLAAAAVIRRENPFRKLNAAQWLVLFYLLWTLLSAVLSPWRSVALSSGPRGEGFPVIALYVLTGSALSLYARPRAYLLRLAAAALCLYCAVCILQFFDLNPFGLYPQDLRWSGREIVYNGSFLGFTGNADIAGAVLCLAFPLFLGCSIRKKQLFFLLPALLCLAVILFSEVRGSLVGIAGGTVLSLPFLFRGSRRAILRRYLVLFFLFLLGLAFLYFFSPPGILAEAHEILHGNFDDSFGTGRIYIWKNTLPLLEDRLFLGGGADCFSRRMTAVFTRVAEDGTVITRSIDCAHCEYLNILVNQGLPAAAALFLAMLLTFVNALKNGSDTSLIFACAILCYGIQALFGISMAANTALFWMLWGLTLSAGRDRNTQ